MPTNRGEFMHPAPHCGTCGGNGTAERMFDANCESEWAHRFVRRMSPLDKASLENSHMSVDAEGKE